MGIPALECGAPNVAVSCLLQNGPNIAMTGTFITFGTVGNVAATLKLTLIPSKISRHGTMFSRHCCSHRAIQRGAA